MENGTGKSSWESIDELQEDIENMKKSLLEWSSPNLDPYSDLKAFQNIVVPEETQLKNVPEEMHDSTYQPVIMDFKAVMQTLQKTIAIEHAKKVREGKESVNMNAILRQKYSDDNYFFPDRILNAGLSKKDFTAPFLIDVKLIDQDLGKSASLKENQATTPKQVSQGNGTRVSAHKDEKRKHDQLSEDALSTNSPTLYAMLEKPESGSKRVKVADGGTFAVPQTRQAAAAKVAQADGGSILARTLSPTVSGTKAVPNTRLQQLSPNKPPVLVRNGVQQTVVRPVAQVQGKVPVSIRPKPEPPQLKPMVHSKASLGALTTAADRLARNPQVTITPVLAEPQDDDFSPKIVNTQGNVKLAMKSPEKRVANGMGQSPPKLVLQKKIPDSSSKPSRGTEFLGCKLCGKTFPSNCDNLFRSHMIIKHEKEITDADILEAKIPVSQWFKCRKCSLMVLNNLEDHNRRCCPDIAYENAFDAIQVGDNVPKIQCGICEEIAESRVHLRAHLDAEHPEISSKTLLDPHFRCGGCLLLFSDAAKLITHVAQCENTTPSQETAEELAVKNLYCEICAKKHSKIRETLFCYQVKSLLRCVLCLHVSINRTNFFNHLKVCHNRRKLGIRCPFCNDDEEKGTRQAFDHFIDQHYNVALKRSGDAALVRGRMQLQAQSAANKLAGNGLAGGSAGVPRTVAAPKPMPTLRPKTVLSTQQNPTGGRANMIPQTIGVPVSSVLRIGTPGINTTTNVLGNNNFPAGTVLRPIVVTQRGGIPQIPLGFTVVPASNIQTTLTTSTGTPITQIEPVDSISEDSILGM